MQMTAFQNPTKTLAWKALAEHFETIKDQHMRDWFSTDPNRFDRFSIRTEEVLFDYSKNRITDKTLKLLIDLANECNLPEGIEQMFSGAVLNQTENRVHGL